MRFWSRIMAGLVCVLLTSPVWAVEVRFDLPGLEESVGRELRQASGSRITSRREESTAQDVIAAARADYETLLEILFDNGYLAAQISIAADGVEVANLSPLNPPQQLDVLVIAIQPGPQFRFAEVEIGPLPADTAIPENLARGAIASTSALQDGARGAVNAWREQGHASAAVVDQSITADHRDATVTARFVIDPGPQARLGRVIFTEDSNLRRPDRFETIAGLEEGRIYSPRAIEQVATRLRDSGVFASVSVQEAEGLRDGDRVDVIVDLRAAKPRRIGAGVEIANDEGVTLSGFWLHRNLLGGAERFRVEGEISGIASDESGGEDYRFAASLLRPATFTREIDFAMNWDIHRRDDPEVFSNGTNLQALLSQRFNEELSVRGGGGLRYLETRDEFGQRRFRYAYALGGARFDNRDNRLDATSGIYADVEISPFFSVDDKGEDGLRSLADLRGYYSLGERVVLAGRAQLSMVSGASLESVPADLLFFSGGGGTVRGHGFQTLGIDFEGELVGGRSRLVLSTEARVDITDKIGAVGFVDWARVSEDWLPRGGDTHAGAGLGLRYDTPLGPLRVDIGLPVEGEHEPGEFGVYIGFGQSF